MSGNLWDEPVKPFTEADKYLAASENFLAVKEKEEEMQLRKMTGHSVAFDLRKPKDIFRMATAQPFNFDEVPEVMGRMAYFFSEATGFDRSGVIVAAVVAAASVIDDSYRLIVRRESDWSESARLWAVLIGTPSSGKSPSIRAATGHIKTMHAAAVALWREQTRDMDREDRPPEPALYTSDATIPALTEVLKGNPAGLLMLTEEFSSWIGAIDATERGEAATNRGHWLQLYDGGSHQINRINRGSVFVPNWSASVLAACTPDGLRQHMRQLPDDGLIHRFIPAIMGPRGVERRGDARMEMGYWNNRLSWWHSKLRQAFITLSPEAQKLFDDEEKHKAWLSDSVYESSPQLASHLGKHGGMVARIALVFHAAIEPQNGVLSVHTMWLAIRFCRKVANHASAMFNGILGTSPAISLAQALGRSIVAEGPLLTTAGRQWMSDHCTEFRKAEDRVKREAVQILEDADWLEVKAGSRSYGGWPTQWQVNDSLSRIFSKEGEEWRARREAVREAIGMGSPE